MKRLILLIILSCLTKHASSQTIFQLNSLSINKDVYYFNENEHYVRDSAKQNYGVYSYWFQSKTVDLLKKELTHFINKNKKSIDVRNYSEKYIFEPEISINFKQHNSTTIFIFFSKKNKASLMFELEKMEKSISALVKHQGQFLGYVEYVDDAILEIDPIGTINPTKLSDTTIRK